MYYTASNLVIIGNGFDLAHGLKTSYGQFIEWVIEKEIDNPHPDNPLFKAHSRISKEKQIKLIYDSDAYIRHKNKFFESLMECSGRGTERNWSDIEGFYFNQLERCLDEKVQNIETTNRDFEVIKNRFEEYLVEHTKDTKPINSYREFFGKLSEKTMILNFNYTDTIQLYVNDKSKIVNIHGELQNPDNPMIFGYAAKEADLSKLYAQNDNQFLFNIKQNRYGDSVSESLLNEFIEKSPTNSDLFRGIRIFIFGHSCSISDEYILNRIVNHEKVREIRIFYYDGIPHQHYEIRTNLKRIMNNRTQEHKIQNIHKCHRMPQSNDSEEQGKDFEEYLEKYMKFKNNVSGKIVV